MKLGVNARKLAEEYALRLRLEAESKLAGRDGVQEKLSFVKMEYFLYALVDADRLLGETRQLERHKEEVEAAWSKANGELDRAQRRLEESRRDFSLGANRAVAEADRGLEKALARRRAEGAELRQQLDDINRQMATRETELLMVLEEAAECDLQPPARYFDGDRLLRQGRVERLAAGGPEVYAVPLETFWKPIDLGEAYVDPRSAQARELRERTLE